MQSGLAVDPAEKAGLAQFVADAVQEGTTTRDSRQIKQEIFAMGATLTAAAGQDTSSFTMRGLADTLPAMLTLLADVVRNPTFPQEEIDLLKANTAQALQAQLASPQFVGQPRLPPDALRLAPLLARRRRRRRRVRRSIARRSSSITRPTTGRTTPSSSSPAM